MNKRLIKKMSNNLKFLSVDMINAANSGHPGVAMGLSDILSVLSMHINISPKRSEWINRDRLIFSGGHASALLYSFLHLSGFDIPMSELKNFRQLNSLAAGHPEIKTHGVEIDTGPLGQGIANAVGYAIAAKYVSSKLNNSIDHKVYCICGDGDLQEGISYEACSLANVYNLDNLILIYDNNGISIEGNVEIAFCDDIKKRFESVGFLVLNIDGHDYDQINEALKIAKIAKSPVLISANTKIGHGALELEGSEKTHGSPLGKELAVRAKKNAGWSEEEFYIDEEVLDGFFAMTARCEEKYLDWNNSLKLNDEEKKFYDSLFNDKQINVDFSSIDLNKDLATRESNEICINEIAKQIPNFLGGSADLAPSNKTYLKGFGEFLEGGKNIHFGIREHSMGAIVNAFARYGLNTYCSTFLVFSDYLKPAIRLSALMKLRNYFIFTHDSIGVGEDGPTHQPIEHISTLRMIPNILTFRPCDIAENIACWSYALNYNGPSAFVLSRSKISKTNNTIPDISNGAYIVKDSNNPEYTIIASGSEVSLALEISKVSKKEIRVVSMPCFELFDQSSNEYKKQILSGKIIGLEAARSYELYKFCDDVIMMNTFGASGKEKDVFKHFGFDVEQLVDRF